jgi:hypothetical protein
MNENKSGLVGIVKDFFRKALIVPILALPLSFSGCHKPDDTPVTDYGPTDRLEIIYVSGSVSPVSKRILYTATDDNNDVVKYVLHIDDDSVTSKHDIDTTMIFYAGEHKVWGQVFDAKKLTDRSEEIGFTVSIDDSPLWKSLSPLPKGKVYLFDYTEGDAEYNNFTTKEQRDAFWAEADANDITRRIPVEDRWINGVLYGFHCVQATNLFRYNSHDWRNLYYDGKLIYDGYVGEDIIDSIFVHRGTGKYRASHKGPIYSVDISASHEMNYAFTGNDLSGESINLIEALGSRGRSNVKPGELGVPFDYPDVTLFYDYVYIDKDGRNSFASIPIIKYDLVNGKLNFIATNPNVEVVKMRKSK